MQNLRISIHALLAESDQAANGLANAPPEISIHALLAESDAHTAKNTSIAGHFYPRSPCGERRSEICNVGTGMLQFLSTLSLRRATSCIIHYSLLLCISIHALLAESDLAKTKIPPRVKNFYPRSPCGERQHATIKTIQDNTISIHALLAESDQV